MFEPIHVGVEVDAKIKGYMREHTGVNYERAMEIVLDADPDLKRQYCGVPEPDEPPRRYSASQQEQAGRRIDDLAQRALHEHPDWDYERALIFVLGQNPSLKRTYAGV